MVVVFEFLNVYHERVELVVTTPKEAVIMFSTLNNCPTIKAWKCVSHTPSAFGCADGAAWDKYRTNEVGFTNDYND